MPDLYLIAGPNGAGKSTYGRLLLPEGAQTLPIFDGDVVYHATLREAFLRLKVAKFAQREAMETTIERFEQLVGEALGRKIDFAYEGHFNGEGPWKTIRRFKEAGYGVHMVFLGLSDVALSVGRVEKRVEQGGHYVSPYNVEVNYHGNLTYLNARFGMLDSLSVLDVSTAQPVLLVQVSQGQVLQRAAQLPTWFLNGLSNVNRLIELPESKPIRRPKLN